MSRQELKIELSSSSLIPSAPIYIVASDQTISGNVICSTQQDRPVGVVTVTLVGRSETRIMEGSVAYRGKATLFRLSKTLHEGPLPANSYTWPFEFTFPKCTEGEEKAWSPCLPYQTTTGHQLPPSAKFQYLPTVANTAADGSVAYKLEATLRKSSKPPIFGASGDYSMDLHYIPYRAIMNPDPQMYLIGMRTFHCRSLYLRPEKIGKPLTFGEKAKSFLWKSSLPCSIFQIIVEVPEVIYVGGPLPILLSLAHDLQNSTAPELPIVWLIACTVTLIRTVHARAKCFKLESLDTTYDFSAKELLAARENMNIQLSEHQNLSDLIPLPSVQTNFGLSYTTYNIAQYCKLEVNVTLKCANKIFTAEFDSRRLTILSHLTKEALATGYGDTYSLPLDTVKVQKALGPVGNRLFLGVYSAASVQV